MVRLQRRMPLRVQLTLGYSLFFTIVLGLLSGSVYFGARVFLRREIVQQLQTSSDLIEQDFDISDDDIADYFGNPAFLLRTHPPHVEGLEIPTLYVQVATLDGTVIVRSASLEQFTLPLTDDERVA